MCLTKPIRQSSITNAMCCSLRSIGRFDSRLAHLEPAPSLNTSFCLYLQTALHTAFTSFTIYWDPCTPDFRDTVLALLAAGMLAPFLAGLLDLSDCLSLKHWHRAAVPTSTMLAGANPNLPFHYGGLEKYTVLHFEAYDGNRLGHHLMTANC